jgi:2'-5' RNA ligase
LLGSIYDPPFVHFTLQLAEEYDWDELAGALAGFAKASQPFELVTVGLLVFTGQAPAIAVSPRKDQALTAFHAAVWDVITPHAQGRVDPFYHPDRWVPHITIKRCGPHPDSFGNAMARLATEDFRQSMTIDTVGVQHDPGKNSSTHYLRLRFPLAGAGLGPARREAEPDLQMNATILECRSDMTAGESPVWRVRIRLDDGRELDQQWDAATLVRQTAEARAAPMYFSGARCRVDADDVVSAVVPNTPSPVA